MIVPKRWAEFQHYKDRSPVWIKLHRKLLDDFAFNRLPLASRALAPMLWLLASEYDDGKITASTEEIAYRLRTTEKDLVDALMPLIDAGFFSSDSITLAPCEQVAIPEKRREETQDKTETEIRAVATATRPKRTIEFEEFWKAYPRRLGANPKTPAFKVFEAVVKQGVDPQSIIAGARRCAVDDRDKIGTPYIPQAVKWLRDRRFDDYQPPPTVGPPTPPPGKPTDEELRKRYGQPAAVPSQTETTDGTGSDHSGELRQEGIGIRPTLRRF